MKVKTWDLAGPSALSLTRKRIKWKT